MRKTLICFIIIFMGLPLMAQVKIKEKVEIKPEEGNLKSSSSTVIYSNGFINGFVMPKSGMLQVYYAYLSHLDLPLPDCAALRTHFLEGDSTKNDLLVPRFPDLITSPKYINDYCNSTIVTRYQYSYNNSSATEEVYLYKAGKVNAGDTVQFSYYSDMIGTGSEFLYGIYDASEIKLSDGTIAGWDIRFGYYDNCIQDFDNVLQISIGIIDPCQIDSCGDDWKPTEKINANNNIKIVGKGDTHSYVNKRGDTKNAVIPDQCAFAKSLANGAQVNGTTVFLPYFDSYTFWDDTKISVCLSNNPDNSQQKSWKGHLENLNFFIYQSLCDIPNVTFTFNSKNKTSIPCKDIGEGSFTDFSNAFTYFRNFLTNNGVTSVDVPDCEMMRMMKRTLEQLAKGSYSKNFLYEFPIYSSKGILEHENDHSETMKKNILNFINNEIENYAELKKTFKEYIKGQCPNDVKEEIKLKMQEVFVSKLLELTSIRTLEGKDATGVWLCEKRADDKARPVYKDLLIKLKSFYNSPSNSTFRCNSISWPY